MTNVVLNRQIILYDYVKVMFNIFNEERKEKNVRKINEMSGKCERKN